MLGVAAESYGFDKATCRFIAYGRERIKHICAFNIYGKPYVLRLIKGAAGHIGQTKAEMDWLLYLADKGASAPFPLKAENGELAVFAEEGGETYIMSAFSMAQGQYWDKNDPNLWNINVFYNWGKAVGDMHRLTKGYKPANDADKRGEFNIRRMIGEKIKAFPSVNRKAEDLLNEIEALPKDGDSYGLIHNDLHPGNFLIDGERINLFDFDGCAYSWYAFDIGTALYLALWLGRNNDAGTDFTNDIIRCFLRGYLSANRLNDFWLSKIPLFMMSCKIALFSLGCDCENPDNESNDEHQRERMRNIENNILFTGCTVDYSLFGNG
ncbi:MAG: phosphotransferase [Oscillospiraceae bacterium]|nr:phosphotransferase [Oscillospiraceae bacterium]